MTVKIVLASLWGSDPPFQSMAEGPCPVGFCDPEEDAWLLVSPQLKKDILAWGGLLHGHFEIGCGWTDGEAKQRYQRDASALGERIRAEMGAGYRVVIDLWPCRD